MNVFRNERARRVLRPLVASIGLLAAMWHSAHALSAFQQSERWKSSDPPLSNYFWGAFQTEASVTIVSLFAGVIAWHLFKPRPQPPPA
jgi:hypothetical protein